MENKAIRLVCCCANDERDKNMKGKLLKQLDTMVNQNLISIWHTDQVSPGHEPEREFEDHINEAQVILLLISSSFLSSRRADIERAQEIRQKREVRVIPIILSDCLWKHEEAIGGLQALPTGLQPISAWTDSDSAYNNVAQGIRGIAQELQCLEMVGEGKKQYDEQYDERNFEGSLDAYETALSLYKELPEQYKNTEIWNDIHWGKGDAFFALKEFESAWESYGQAVFNDPKRKNDKKLKSLGWMFEQGKRREQALLAYEQALVEEPNNSSLHLAKGRVLLSLDHLKDALEAYKQTALLNPQFTPQPPLGKEIASEKHKKQLNEGVVQITFNEHAKGTGFFVAPGVVLTVVPASLYRSGDPIKIAWQGENLVARIGKIRETAQGTNLALLYINQNNQTKLAYSYLPLSGDILSFDSLSPYVSHSSGFSTKLTMVGFEGDTERMILKSDSSGISNLKDEVCGAPLVNLRTGSVCGIMINSYAGALKEAENAIHMQTVFETFQELVILHKNMQLAPVDPDTADNIFIAYAEKDTELLDQLLQALQKAKFANLRLYWNNPLVPAQQSNQAIQYLNNAQFVLFLVSPNFLDASDLQKSYVARAMERYQQRDVEVIPILLRPADAWRDTPFGALQELPKKGCAVIKLEDTDKAFSEIVQGIEEALQAKPSSRYLEPGYSKACRVFYSYADEDEKAFLDIKSELKSKGHILRWHRYEIIAGSNKEYEIHRRLEAAQIVILFLSKHYNRNSALYKLEAEYAYALQRRRKKDLQIIPVRLDDTDAEDPSFPILITPDELKKSLDDRIKDANKRLAEAFINVNKPTTKQRVLQFLSFTLVLVLALSLVTAGALFQKSVPPTANVSVSFAPLTEQIDQKTYTFQAVLATRQAIIDKSALPAHYSTYYDTMTSAPTPTTGTANCFLGIHCPRAVSQDDENQLSGPTEQQLADTISWNLQEQIGNMHGTEINQMNFTVLSTSSNPEVGHAGENVTVTVAGMGKAEYVLNDDVTKLVHQLLVAQVPAGYQIIEQTFRTGPLVILGDNGMLAMPAVAIAQHQFSQAQLDTFCKGLAGKSVVDAKAYLRQQHGVDPQSIQISGNGGNLPDNFQQISVIQRDPNLPAISLT